MRRERVCWERMPSLECLVDSQRDGNEGHGEEVKGTRIQVELRTTSISHLALQNDSKEAEAEAEREWRMIRCA
jgi:hypothetical protein